MAEWEDYEMQIFEKLKEEFPDSEILKNQKIEVRLSKVKRQIDILVKGTLVGRDILGVVECKNFNEKVDVKVIDGFAGFLEDVGANIGILITNKGFTKGAENRANNAYGAIKLDIVKFEHLDAYHFIWDECDICSRNGRLNEIIWGNEIALIKDDIVTTIELGQCGYCGTDYFKCTNCGFITDYEAGDTKECYCGTEFFFDSEYIGSGMTDINIRILRQEKTGPKFIDPSQLKLLK